MGHGEPTEGGRAEESARGQWPHRASTQEAGVCAYDSKNRCLAKTVYAWDAGTSTRMLTRCVRFVYDGWQMIAELDHTSATGTGLAGSEVDRTFLWGPDLSGSMTGAGGVGGLLSTTYQGITYEVCSDANGNVTGLVPVSGTAAGTLMARFDDDPFVCSTSIYIAGHCQFPVYFT